jgi:hypothetical protein
MGWDCVVSPSAARRAQYAQKPPSWIQSGARDEDRENRLIVDWLILTLLVVEVVVLSRLDRRRFGTWVTPFTLLGYPYTAVALLAYFLAPIFDFVPLYSESVIVWIVGLLLTWAAGNFLGWGLLDMRLAPTIQAVPFPFGEPKRNQDAAASRLAMILAWASLPLLIYGVIVSAKAAGGWKEIGSEDFRTAYTYGLHAHAVVLATLLTIVLIGLYRRGDRRAFGTITMLLVFILLTRVKGTILQAVLGGLLLRVTRGQFHLTFKKVSVVLFCTYAIFNAVYLISMNVFLDGDPSNGEVYSFLGRHFLFYLFAGPLALGVAMRSGISDVGLGWPALFGPFINLYHAIFGGAMMQAGSTHEKGMDTDLLATLPGQDNVYTFFGTLHLYLGAFGAILYVFIAGLLCYGFLLGVKRNNNVWLTASYCLIASELVLGFFELYFWYLTPYEIVVMGLVLNFASKRHLLAPRFGPTAPSPNY